MYEDNWLAHQETAITQLVNGLFDSVHGIPGLQDGDLLRHDLLHTYQDPYFSLLYKRLHASLLYGALSVPKDVLARINRLPEDIGLRRAFLNLWLDTYELSALRAAAETVIGRKISLKEDTYQHRNLPNSLAKGCEKALRQTLEAFLETFLLRNEDAEPVAVAEKVGDSATVGWAYRRTLLRSIMMITLLDKSRTNPKSSLPRCLFVSSSQCKSSHAVLQKLGRMLLPSVGNITRPLNHLDCQVKYKQHPLQEYKYRINNLAVDLRDGILLTRLVELLLYPSASFLAIQQHKPDSTDTVTMPTGEALALPPWKRDWPLSQHLKFPCVGRVTKVFNVQIALGALAGVRGVGFIAQDIRAEDIVDGYREKTVALLWGLVGKWGLTGLVDWDDVQKEIVRLKRKAAYQMQERQKDRKGHSEEVEENFDEGYERYSFLLKEWASCLAGLKGLQLDNLTTSFADGRIFESIVDEYEGYICVSKCVEPISPNASDEGTPGGRPEIVNLATRLRALGCSAQFCKSLAPVQG
jgi:abnormal spindle-like microcephaly-associated protein